VIQLVELVELVEFVEIRLANRLRPLDRVRRLHQREVR
jgi:hypothetical protein